MRRSLLTVGLLCAVVGCTHEEEEDDFAYPERSAADPSFDPGVEPPPTVPPPPTHPTVAEPSVFVQATPGIYEMALDATHLYWVTDGIFGPSEVWRADRATAQREHLVTSDLRVYALAIDETHVYFGETAGETGNVIRVPKAGGATQTVVAAADNPISIAVDETHVYFPRAFSPDGMVLRAPKEGGVPELVVADVDNPWDFAVDETHLYVSEQNRGRVIRVPKTGGDAEVLASGWLGTGWIAVGGGNAYFQTCAVGSCQPAALRSVAAEGGGVFELLESPEQPGKVAFGGAYVLWGSWFVPLDETAPTHLLATAKPDAVTVGVAGDETAVFVADHPTGTIFTAAVSLE